MVKLNLVDPEKSSVRYKISKFPDGQQQVTILFDGVTYQDLPKGHPNDIKSHSVEIRARLNNFTDLELIICTVASLRGLGVKEIHLYVPYIEGARSDRKFEDGSNNYLKDVICPILNSLKLDSIRCLDPHSDCLEMGLNNFQKESNTSLVEFAIHSIFNSKEGYSTEDLYKDKILVSPDAGANKKIYKLAEKIGYKGDIITCSKDRDTLGFAAKGAWFQTEEDHMPDGFDIIKSYNIYKDPVTDDGTKKSLKGLLYVDKISIDGEKDPDYIVMQEATSDEESKGLLQIIFEDGKYYNQTTLTEIRKRLNG